MTTLTFQNTALSTINRNNQIWLSSIEVGQALGYSSPIDGVRKLYNSHQDEFTENMTALVDMQTKGGMQKVRIFSLRGCHLIGMLSHTKVAKDFRKWVLDILDKETNQPQQLALPEPEPIRKIKISNHEFEALLVVLNKFTPMAQQFAEIVKEQHRQLYDVLALERHVRNPTAAKAHDIAYEFNYWIKLARNALNRYEP